MKIIRQNINESYTTTVDWLNDFSRDMEKNADFISNVKTIFRDRRNKFSSIDEKMDDIKNRAGFKLISSDANSGSDSIKSAMQDDGTACGCTESSCAMGPESNGKCGSCDPQEDIDVMRNIINYIVSYINHKPHSNPAVIFSHCRSHPGLGFKEMEKKIDHNKLKSFVLDKLRTHKVTRNAVEYIPDDGERDEAADVPELVQNA